MTPYNWLLEIVLYDILHGYKAAQCLLCMMTHMFLTRLIFVVLSALTVFEIGFSLFHSNFSFELIVFDFDFSELYTQNFSNNLMVGESMSMEWLNRH